MAKAGKVRKATPKVERRIKSTPSPRVRNKRNYVKRVVLKLKVGQPR